MSAAAVRERCTILGELAIAGKTQWFGIEPTRLGACAQLVADICSKNYPLLDIPYHSRWRHFVLGETDLWRHYISPLPSGDDADLSRTAIDLVIISVLIDAGAGPDWSFDDPVTGMTLTRSEGLAAASIDLFFNHLAKYGKNTGFYVDSSSLCSLSEETFFSAMQHSGSNPLVGIEGRLALLRGLGDTLSSGFGDGSARPGDIYDTLLSKAHLGSIRAGAILDVILQRFGKIWPNGLVHQDVNLGDTGYHRLVRTQDVTNNIVPFHKLSQWLSYSLIEPLQWSGIQVTHLDDLTGLPEYRNGGLLIDTEVLVPSSKRLLSQRLEVASEPVVEWRALTVYLLDQIADEVRQRLGCEQLSLASILQGGTWSAGRAVASRLRRDGSPPIDLAIDGTVF